MKHSRILIFAAIAACAALQAGASLNLRLQSTSSNQVELKLSRGEMSDDVDTIKTTGTDPFVQVMPLTRDLDDDEVIFTFEYKCSAEIRDLQIFFGAPASEDRSQHFGAIAKSSTWRTYSIDISEARKNFSWGSMGNRLRLDFGYDPNITLIMRHLRVCKASNDPWVPTEREKYDIAAILKLGLPVLDIETVNHEEPTCDYVSCPPGSMGGGIANATKVPGHLNIYVGNDAKNPVYASGEYNKDVSGMTIKIRGNTSAYPSKKPFKIKLQKKADLLLRGDDATYKDKDWILLRDPTLLTITGCKISELMGLQWAPKCHYVNVLFNGDFRGMYLLIESVKRNPKCRLDVAEDGYIFALDPYWWNENSQYVNSVFTPSYNYTFKYPDWEDMSQSQIDYIQGAVSNYEYSVAQGTYPKYIDVPSFAAWLLGHDLFGTYDSGGSNMYYTKYDATDETKIRMANMWDFDSSEQLRDAWSNLHIHRFPQFFATPNKEFSREYVRKWDEVKGTFFTDILKFIDDFAQSAEGKGFDKSIPLDNSRWSYGNQGLSAEVKRAHDWFDRRKVWLEGAIAGIDTTVFIKDVKLEVGKTIQVQAEDYDEGGQGVAYCSHNTTRGAYRTDNAGVSLTSGSELVNGWAIADMGDEWNADGLNLTREQAMEKWGAWFNYTFTAEEDMQVAINIKGGAHWASYGAITANGCKSSIIGEPDLTNWVKTYSGAALLTLDGVELTPNQKSHPVNTGTNKEAYMKILADKSKWTPNPAGENTIWIYPDVNNMESWQPYYQKDVYGEPDNFTVNITKGKHSLRLSSLASQWMFDEISIKGMKAGAVEDLTVNNFAVWTIGTEIHVRTAGSNDKVEVYNLSGQCLYAGTKTTIDVKAGGVYIVRVNGNARKVWVK